MTAARLSIVSTTIVTWWDLNRVLRALWAPTLMAMALFVAMQFSAIVCARLFAQTYVAKMLIKGAVDLAGLVLIAPFLIAVHRFIQLGEVARTYEFLTDAARVRSFAGWLLVLGFMASIPSLIDILTTPTGVAYYTGSRPPVVANAIPRYLMFAIVVAIFIVVTRLMIVLPAVAIEVDGINLSSVLADTRSNVGRIASAAFFCLLPLLCLFMILSLLTKHILPSKTGGLVIYLILQIMIFIAIAFTAAVASRIYLALADPARLSRARSAAARSAE